MSWYSTTTAWFGNSEYAVPWHEKGQSASQPVALLQNVAFLHEQLLVEWRFTVLLFDLNNKYGT